MLTFSPSALRRPPVRFHLAHLLLVMVSMACVLACQEWRLRTTATRVAVVGQSLEWPYHTYLTLLSAMQGIALTAAVVAGYRLNKLGIGKVPPGYWLAIVSGAVVLVGLGITGLTACGALDDVDEQRRQFLCLRWQQMVAVVSLLALACLPTAPPRWRWVYGMWCVKHLLDLLPVLWAPLLLVIPIYIPGMLQAPAWLAATVTICVNHCDRHKGAFHDGLHSLGVLIPIIETILDFLWPLVQFAMAVIQAESTP